MSEEDKVNAKDNKKPFKKLVKVDSDDEVGDCEIVKKNDIKIHVNIENEDKVRRNKSSVFVKERNELLKKISEILCIKGDTCIIDVGSITEDKEKKILELTNDMKKFFAVGGWNYFKDTVVNKSIVSLIKSIYKDMNYDVRQNSTHKMTNGVKSITTNLIFVKKL